MESNFCGRLSHVSSHPVMIPTFDSPGDYPQRIQSDDVQRNREAVPEAGRTNTVHTSEDRQNQGTIPMPTFATRPFTTSSTMPVEVPQNYMVGQQRKQISELQFDKFPNPQSFFGVENSIQNSSDYLARGMGSPRHAINRHIFTFSHFSHFHIFSHFFTFFHIFHIFTFSHFHIFAFSHFYILYIFVKILKFCTFLYIF